MLDFGENRQNPNLSNFPTFSHTLGQKLPIVWISWAAGLSGDFN